MKGNSNEAQRRPKEAHRNYKENNKAQTGRPLNRKVGCGKQVTKDPQRSGQVPGSEIEFPMLVPKVQPSNCKFIMFSTMAKKKDPCCVNPYGNIFGFLRV